MYQVFPFCLGEYNICIFSLKLKYINLLFLNRSVYALYIKIYHYNRTEIEVGSKTKLFEKHFHNNSTIKSNRY